jgi:hypothetical protein
VSTQYRCRNDNRHQAVARAAALNGIDYLEVASPDQKTLALYFHHPLPGQPGGIPASPQIRSKNVAISGGARIRDITVVKVTAADNVLTVEVDKAGDFSFYTLQLVDVSKSFDPQLSEVEFSFKAGCPSEFDCRPEHECPPAQRTEPQIDYLAKDYAGFRRLMLDRMSLLAPQWRERNPADAHVALVEMLACVGDHLSYYQDAVGTEAYLGTARKRVSVRRHARLLDYFMHDGCNARTWLYLAASQDDTVKAGTAFATKGRLPPSAARDSAIIFETLHDLDIYENHNEISFHTWGNTQCCLPAGATRATLNNEAALALKVGSLVLFEEVRDPGTGKRADANPLRRHVVRLTKVTPANDAVTATKVLDIDWAPLDALPFPLCLSGVVADEEGKVDLRELSVARGNIALADHGYTTTGEDLGRFPRDSWAQPAFLSLAPLTQQGRVRDELGALVLDENMRPAAFDPTAPASRAMHWELRDTLPAIVLTEDNGDLWSVTRDLLNADRFTREFTVETDEDERAALRFGDGIFGQAPAGAFAATYRVGNGGDGNVGIDTIVQLVLPVSGVASVRNPLPAAGGSGPESMEQVRQYAPQAFRVQQRAVTEDDWVEVAQRHPEVQQAAARFRWTGSWTTVFVTIDRRGGLDVDADFKGRMRAYLERYRIAGYDLEVIAPLFVPLDIKMCVCAKPGYFASDIKKALLRVFGAGMSADGQRGFFHPDNFTFGQPVYLSKMYGAAMRVPGVASVEVVRLQRSGKVANGELDAGRLQPAALEIVRLANDRNFPENGRLELDVHGGL